MCRQWRWQLSIDVMWPCCAVQDPLNLHNLEGYCCRKHTSGSGCQHLLSLALIILCISHMPIMHAQHANCCAEDHHNPHARAGDWFNKVDWSLQTNNFGVGLPPASKNKAAWPLKMPRLVPELKPSPDLIKASK